jgi:uncharacterized membrane protein YsdA (DUF1294 family)
LRDFGTAKPAFLGGWRGPWQGISKVKRKKKKETKRFFARGLN